MAKRKNVDRISPHWKMAILCFGVFILYFSLDFLLSVFFGVGFDISAANRAAVKSKSIAIWCFFVGLFCLRNSVLNEEGITLRWLCIPCRTIKWEQIEKVVIYPNAVSCSALLVLQGCPKPDPTKNERYNGRFAGRHFFKTVEVLRAEKYIHLIEKYWPGEIENKAILYMKRE